MSKTTLSPAILKRAKTEALSYIENQLRVCYQDCSDSGEEADRHLARFDGIVDDTITMDAFIEEYLLKEYTQQWASFIEDQGIGEDERQDPGVCELPVPYDTFKHLLS